ncbi:phosphoadenosine phosphosulfate reductase [Salpingoeca rosetta]|uniref:Phosphoadenosine phosphosulfate reductase n=1 Tax=Salpingoeca rosetta (strain ATCC 50818 / BSB-021) TaxID=946362 RepID=F2ULF0_SALR5|nr:phosphoadenosine phosphosulfate reductase [Salpingoeca rosetta]EGD77949.1 phosphoadenosine phosphosulfate reductase [Salpingoeca rosetta]|eukprot:XP_004990012.1 phosphoadenosine phosphosulfate reductase [Salpingoeca rosetta]
MRTLELLERVQAKYGRQVVRYRPMTAQTREEFEDLYGEELWQRDPELYQYMTKVEPTGRALRDYGVNVWITGRRRSQGAVRSQLHVVERTKDGRFKVNPMAFWPFETVQAYIREHNVPYNALLDQGYKSIGDVHSTVPVGSDAPERSGRWSGDYRTECGMHTMLETMGCDDQAGSTTSTATSSGIVSAFSSMLSLAEHNSSPPPQQQQQQQQQHHDSDGGDGDDGGVELHVGKSAMGTGVQQAAVHAQGSMASKVGGAGRGASAADGDGTQADAGARQEAAAISD